MPSQLSDVQIFNMALTRIGSTQVVTSFTQATNEAALANVWYYTCRDYLLRAFAWPWAQVWAQLTQVSAAGVPANAEWNYSYRYPADCMTIRRLMRQPASYSTVSPPIYSNNVATQAVPYPPPWTHGDADPYPVLYAVSNDVNGRLIVTNTASAWIQYTQAVTDPTQFPQDFADLLAWRVASELAMALARSDERRAYCVQMYQRAYVLATARSLNEQQATQPYVDYNAESVRARGTWD